MLGHAAQASVWDSGGVPGRLSGRKGAPVYPPDQTRPMQGVGLAARTPHAHLTPISIVFLLLTGAQQMLSCLCVCMCCVT